MDAFDECFEEGLVPEVGDQIEWVATKVDQGSRRGVVTAVRGRMITVRWASGDQSVLVPGPGTLTVLGRAGTGPLRANLRPKATRGAKAATPARRSTIKKQKAPVRKTTKKEVATATAKQATPKAPIRTTTKKGVATATAKQATPKAPVRKTTKRPTAQRRTTATKKAAPRRVR
jgi:hypothetical protein